MPGCPPALTALRRAQWALSRLTAEYLTATIRETKDNVMAKYGRTAAEIDQEMENLEDAEVTEDVCALHNEGTTKTTPTKRKKEN